jgi:hypothetical protein
VFAAVAKRKQGFSELPVQILGTATEGPQEAAWMEFRVGFRGPS